MKKMVHGDLTVMLSLVFLLILSLVGAALESASIQTAKNEKRADTSRAMESIFAEYQKTLFEEYQIFAIDMSYETGACSIENILNRLAYYGAENMEMNVKKIRYLSDQNGKAFYEQAVQYEKEKTGAEIMEDVFGDVNVLETYDNKWETYKKDDDETSEKINQMLKGSEQQLPDTNNPIRIISKLKNEGLLNVVLPETFSLSQKAISLEEMPSKRELQKGSGEWKGQNEQMQDTIFFNLYLDEKFGNIQRVREKSALSYEMEYLLMGNSSDKENLEAVISQLSNLRFAANYMYLLTDSVKQAEARTMAATLCTLLTVPGITEVVAQGILLAWAYGEALQDVKALIMGQKVSLWKTEATWKLSLTNLLTMENSSALSAEGDLTGLDYETYLCMLLFLKDKTMLSMRALDLIEINIKTMYGKTFFKVDQCITGLEIEALCRMRRGIEYQFTTSYEYQ